jgi:hypothetical protein
VQALSLLGFRHTFGQMLGVFLFAVLDIGRLL